MILFFFLFKELDLARNRVSDSWRMREAKGIWKRLFLMMHHGQGGSESGKVDRWTESSRVSQWTGGLSKVQ